MKKLGKVLLICFTVLFVLLAFGISLTIGWRPFIGPKSRTLTTRKFDSTPQRLARGKYLFNGIAGCVDCHSQHDMSQHGVPARAGTEGGGEEMAFEGLPGRIVAPNITPDPATGSGTWSDDQLARAIREGIGHDDRTLFPMMPYENYRYMSDEDLASVVVYIRSLPPIHRELPKSEVIFPVRYLVRSVPQPIADPVSAPSLSDQTQWGKYLVTLGGCQDCHTPHEKGQPLAGMEFAGSGVMKAAWGEAAPANITLDPSGISYYDESLFLQVIRTGYVGARPLSSIMPFNLGKSIADDDLKAIFAYLRTVPQVKHRVDNSLPPTYCKLCRGKHGAGDQN
jgi:mono/diheme cytochrome c family protein